MLKSRRKLLGTSLSSIFVAGLGIPTLSLAQSLPRPISDGDVDWVLSSSSGNFQSTENRRTAITPDLRALCKTEAGIRAALTFARVNKLPFSLRSGGHCFEGLSQNSELIVDLRKMSGVKVAKDGKTVRVQPGATIGDVNGATEPYQAALPAGFCQSVGIGGHIGGGGMGLMSRQFGLACDHLTAARVMLADGTIVTASNTSHPDLFWALRGGGSGSFGVVSEFTFRLRPVARATFVEMFWSLDTVKGGAFLADWQSWAKGNPRSIGAVLNVQNHRADRLIFQVMMLSSGQESQAKQAAQKLFSLAPPLNPPRIHQGSYAAVANVIWPKDGFPSKSSKIASDFLPGIVPSRIWKKTLEAMLSAQIGRQTMLIDALGGAVSDIDGTTTAFPHRKSADFLLQYDAATGGAQTAKRNISDMRAIRQTLQNHVTGGAYVNYPDRDLHNWPQAYWQGNLERLKRVKQRYDPNNLFRHAQSIPL